MFVILSGIYGMIIVVLGGVLPVAEVFEGPENTYYIEVRLLFGQNMPLLPPKR